ncbi:MAG: N-acetyltransferase [Bacillota bacterium]
MVSLEGKVTIRPVVTKSDRKKFVELPWRLYRQDPHWVPPLLQDMHSTLDPQKNVLLRLGPHRHFLAERHGKTVGRLGVGMDLHLNRAKSKNLSYLTLFESIEDYAVAESLFEAGLNWLRSQGAASVSGPQSPSNGDDYRGLLIKGFDSPPVLLNSYNPPFYMEFFDGFGFEKEFDRHAYYYDLANGPSDRLKRGVEAAQKRYGFTVRSINLKSLQTEMLLIKDILDRSMPEWPDIIPPSLEEIEAETTKLKQLAVPDLILIIEGPDGKPAGFSVALPDYNQVLPLMNGRLFPLGAIRFLMLKKSITGIRLFILFVTPAWRKKGVAAALYYYTMLNACRLGYTFGEGSTIHEFNTQMNLDAKKAGGELYKVYRIYRKEL